MPTWLAVIKALVPLIKLLIELLFPKLKGELEDVWEFVEGLVQNDSNVPKAVRTARKQEVFNDRARALLVRAGVAPTDSQLNVLREITHTLMTSPKKNKK